MGGMGLMKSERIAAERAAEREQRTVEAAARLDPPWPYAVFSFPEGFGILAADGDGDGDGEDL